MGRRTERTSSLLHFIELAPPYCFAFLRAMPRERRPLLSLVQCPVDPKLVETDYLEDHPCKRGFCWTKTERDTLRRLLLSSPPMPFVATRPASGHARLPVAANEQGEAVASLRRRPLSASLQRALQYEQSLTEKMQVASEIRRWVQIQRQYHFSSAEHLREAAAVARRHERQAHAADLVANVVMPQLVRSWNRHAAAGRRSMTRSVVVPGGRWDGVQPSPPLYHVDHRHRRRGCTGMTTPR